MYYEKYGQVYFKYKIVPNWVTPESKSEELLICSNGESVNAVYKTKLIDEELTTHIENNSDCGFVKEITNEDLRNIIAIIEENKELIMVNSEIRNDVCDGQYEYFYFEGESFNRITEGDCVVSIGEVSEDRIIEFEDERIVKNLKDSIIVSKTVHEILDFLKSIGIQVFEEDEDFDE